MHSYITVLMLVSLGLFFKFMDYCYHYKPNQEFKRDVEDIHFSNIRKKFGSLNYKKFDNYLSIMLYASCYLFIFSAIILSNIINNIFVDILLILFVSGRVRSLQELGHYSVHYALCPNKNLGMILANSMYQYPWQMPSAQQRRKIHVKEHHNRVNNQNDPDLLELKDKKIFPGISALQFWVGVFYPLTVKGIYQRLTEIFRYYNSSSLQEKISRLLFSLILMSFIYYLGSWKGVVMFYFIPLLLVYPLFYWFAHLALHRWYAECSENINYLERELILGRPTNFHGFLGWIVKENIFPYGDSYHLAHSLLPTTRWNYLSSIDKIFKKYLNLYIENESYGLFFSRKDFSSAISELKNRLVAKNVNFINKQK